VGGLNGISKQTISLFPINFDQVWKSAQRSKYLTFSWRVSNPCASS